MAELNFYNPNSSIDINLPLPVSAYIQVVNELLQNVPGKVIGEVTQVNRAASGHVYFTIKDKIENAILECKIWKSNYQMNGIQLAVGMEVILTGEANIYAPRGQFGFIVKTISLVGDGRLKQQYDERKRKLQLEGLFDEKRKRKITPFPQHIGVITARQGAVIHDFMNNLGRNGFKIHFADSRVEGQEALPHLLAALHHLKQYEFDCLVLMRGGGSMQSLLAFDNEQLVRTVAGYPVPVLTAIGHHQDVPLAALASDVSVSTPTAAATFLCAEYERADQTLQTKTQSILVSYSSLVSRTNQQLTDHYYTIFSKFNSLMNHVTKAESELKSYLSRLYFVIQQAKSEITIREVEINQAMNKLLKLQSLNLVSTSHSILKHFSKTITKLHEELSATERMISLHDPKRMLSLGFSLIYAKEGQLVRHTNQVKPNSHLKIQVSDGMIEATADNVSQSKTHE